MATMRNFEVMSDKCSVMASPAVQAREIGCRYSQVVGTVMQKWCCCTLHNVNIFRVPQVIYLLSSILINLFVYDLSFTLLYRQNLSATLRRGRNILLRTLFWNCLNLYVSHLWGDQFSHPYKTTVVIIILYLLKNHHATRSDIGSLLSV
jgi:hypothetical protein